MANNSAESNSGFSLYKFEHLDLDTDANVVWSLDNLKNSRLFFGTLKKFNDPFEGQLVFTLEPYEHKKALSYLKIARRMHVNFGIPNKPKLDLSNAKRAYEFLADRTTTLKEDALKKVSNEMGICCFSMSDEDFEPWENLLMWSHYAGGFTGFCIEFSGRKLVDSVRASDGVFMRPIDYRKVRIRFNAESKLDLLSKNKLVSDWADREPLVDALVATKPHEWKYEREVRLLKLRHAEKCISYPPSAIRRIIISSRADEKLVQQIKDIMSSYKGIEIYRAALDSYDYRLTLTKILCENAASQYSVE